MYRLTAYYHETPESEIFYCFKDIFLYKTDSVNWFLLEMCSKEIQEELINQTSAIVSKLTWTVRKIQR